MNTLQPEEEAIMGKATVRYSLKTISLSFPAGSIERVYLHGMWQRDRGRNPTLLFGNHTDAKEAFAAATEMVGPYIESVRQKPFSRYHDWSRWVHMIISRTDPAEMY